MNETKILLSIRHVWIHSSSKIWMSQPSGIQTSLTHQLWIQSATWSVSLESYHLYLQSQKVSKNPQNYCVHNNLPKNAKSLFGSFGLLEVKLNCQICKYIKFTKKLKMQIKSKALFPGHRILVYAPIKMIISK
jgi:hypothetical protein